MMRYKRTRLHLQKVFSSRVSKDIERYVPILQILVPLNGHTKWIGTIFTNPSLKMESEK